MRLGIALIVIGVLGRIALYFLKPETKFFIILSILVVSIGGVIAITDLYKKYEANKKSALSGKLNAKVDDSHSDKVTLLLASNTLDISKNFFIDGRPIRPFKILCGLDYPITIVLKNDNIFITARVSSLDGRTVAELNNNEWSVNPNNYFDRNYNGSTLEVIDEYSIPILQIELVNQNTVRIGGVFYDGNRLIIISEHLKIVGGPMSEEKILEGCRDLKRIFAYPSNQHFGEKSNR